MTGSGLNEELDGIDRLFSSSWTNIPSRKISHIAFKYSIRPSLIQNFLSPVKVTNGAVYDSDIEQLKKYRILN